MRQWLVTSGPSGVNVIPGDDILVHVMGPACPCAPRVERQGHECCRDGKALLHVRNVTVHEAMDGRPN